MKRAALVLLLALAAAPGISAKSHATFRVHAEANESSGPVFSTTQALFGKLRLDANVFRRNFRNFADDDVLLATGVSFPIAFDNARIIGEVIRDL